MPSIHEGFGLPALEVIASGTPLVVGRGGAAPEVTGQRGAIVVEPRDVSGLAAAAIMVLQDKKLASRLSATGRTRAQVFSWEGTIDETIDNYRRVVGARLGQE